MAIATACLWGLNAQALGLGRLTVQSALGEPLRAEIDVTSMTPEEAGTLALRVATPDAYRAAGVDYNAVLPGTTVQLLKRADGRSYLRLTSDRAVVEPFVDVILDLSWASGRLVREFTLLLDADFMYRNDEPGYKYKYLGSVGSPKRGGSFDETRGGIVQRPHGPRDPGGGPAALSIRQRALQRVSP